MNKETLEEAAYRLYPIVLEDEEWDKNKQYRDEWIEGAKWQQERLFSEEEVIALLQKYRYDLSSGKTPNLGDTTKFWFEENKKK